MADDYKDSVFTDSQLEEILLFWLCATKSNFLDIGLYLRKLLGKWNNNGTLSPFKTIRNMVDKVNLPLEMKNFGIQDYNDKAVIFIMLAFSDLDLRTCSQEELQKVKGVSKKSIKCFLVHTRPHYMNTFNKNVEYTQKQYEKLFNKHTNEDKKEDKSNYQNEYVDIDLDLWSLFRKNKQ